MCLDCFGLGVQYGANLAHKPAFMNLTAAAFVRMLWKDKVSKEAIALFEQLLEDQKIDPCVPLHELPPAKLQWFLNGSNGSKSLKISQGPLKIQWMGINNVLAKAGKHAKGEIKETILPLLDEFICNSCEGSRLNPLARQVTIQERSIAAVCKMPVRQVQDFVEAIRSATQENKVLEEVRVQLANRLSFLMEVGLDYISLDRKAPTLSGGEAQRIRLARQLGSGLTGALYVLDEPTIGLHPHDNDRLNSALKKLKELGNTLILVEHDPLTIATADYILDFGPQSGEHGGHVIAQGTYTQILHDPNSITGAYLSGEKSIPLPKKRRSLDEGSFAISKATANNLKNLSINFPVGALTCLTGVSGSGKSTLMQKILLPAMERGLLTTDTISLEAGVVSGIDQFDKVISIDQNPIGHTVRSDVGTYADVLGRMRDFFSSLPLARTKGLQPKHFSYNHRRGMCTACWGLGYRKIEMHFLPAVKVLCEDCKGLRLNPISLEVLYQGKNFGQYLQTTVDEARITFTNHPRIVRVLDTLIAVGLGYLQLGQEIATLSGGEAQRIKLSRELAKRSSGKTLYLLDEPTTGLHSDDIKKLLAVLHKLVDKGNTMVIIEHNLDVIKNADYIIDLGPGAGEKGGKIVCKGKPEDIVKCRASLTGIYLKEVL